MTLRPIHHDVFAAAGQGLASALREVLPADSPVKHLMAACDLSGPTAGRIMRGELPSTRTLLSLWHRFGMPAVAATLRPVMGDVVELNNAARLAAMASSLKEMARHVEEIGVANRSGRAGVRSVLGLGSARGDNPSPEAAADRDGVDGGEGDAAGGRRAATGAVALVETRQPPDRLLSRPDGEALRRHLTANVVSLDAARALVQGDNLGRTGLAYQKPGDDWTLLPARENRLWTPDAEPRPVSRFEGNVVELRHALDAAAASAEPVFVTHAGALLREGRLMPFHSAVVRIGFREGGTVGVLTDFVRLAS